VREISGLLSLFLSAVVAHLGLFAPMDAASMVLQQNTTHSFFWIVIL